MEKLYYINCPSCGKVLQKSRTVGESTTFTKCNSCNKMIKIKQEDDRIMIKEVENKYEIG